MGCWDTTTAIPRPIEREYGERDLVKIPILSYNEKKNIQNPKEMKRWIAHMA